MSINEKPVKVQDDDHFAESCAKKKGVCQLTPYIDDEGISNIHKFKYSGSDVGFMYKWIYCPASVWGVEHTPAWIAPNVITLFGALFTFVPFGYIVYVNGTQFGENAPPVSNLFCLIAAVCYFIGRLLDEMDGKHARATGNASVVGLLFDHGCDSFIVGFFMMIIAKILQINNPILNYVFIANAVAQFYFATLEEYYIGGLHLPMFNGVTDGSIVVFILFFILFLFGPEILQIELIKGQEWCKGSTLVALSMVVIQGPNAYKMNFQGIFNRPDDSESGEKVVPKQVFIQTIAYLFVVGLITSLAFIGEEPLMYQNTVKSKWNDIIWVILVNNFMMQHLAVHIQVAHITLQKMSPLSSRLYWWNVVVCSSILVTSQAMPELFKTKDNLVYILKAMVAFSFICQMHYMANVVHQLASYLKIRIFRVKDIVPLVEEENDDFEK